MYSLYQLQVVQGKIFSFIEQVSNNHPFALLFFIQQIGSGWMDISVAILIEICFSCIYISFLLVLFKITDIDKICHVFQIRDFTKYYQSFGFYLDSFLQIFIHSICLYQIKILEITIRLQSMYNCIKV